MNTITRKVFSLSFNQKQPRIQFLYQTTIIHRWIWGQDKNGHDFRTVPCNSFFLQHAETVNPRAAVVAPYPHLQGDLVQLGAGAVAATTMPSQGGLAQGRAG